MPINLHRRDLLAASLISAVLAPEAMAQSESKSQGNREIFLYDKPDRESKLRELAKKEGTVRIFTSMNLKDVTAIADQFTRKYGITTYIWRASSEEIRHRGLTEANASLFSCDVFETNAPEMEALSRKQVLGKFYSPYFKDYPASAFRKHGSYVATRFNFFTMAYNSTLVKPEEVPNSLEDLLHPRFAGKIGLEMGDSDWFAAVVKSMGEAKGLAYFRALAATKPQMIASHSMLASVVAIGQVSITPALYNHSVEKLIAQKGDIRWKALEPTFGRAGAIGPAQEARNPHAAMLFIDFMLSPEGQSILVKRKRVPASSSTDSKLNKFSYEMIDPAINLDEGEKWEKLWADHFMKGRRAVQEKE